MTTSRGYGSRVLGLRPRPGMTSHLHTAHEPRDALTRRMIVKLYDRWILPSVIELGMRQQQLEKYRRELGGDAEGRVLEIGVGSGLNFSFYGPQVERVIGLDPSTRLLALARRRADAAGIDAMFVQASATAIPLPARTVDAVVMTWTLCSIADRPAALIEMRRVLKPAGKLLFAEHGLSPDPVIERWQHRLTPIWRHVAGGCHLDRKIDDLIRAAGFDMTRLRTEYARGPRSMAYMYVGCARSAA
jgi:ubiquinone/menaquinone biosynthesis C-methylase UbiE